MEKQKKHSWKLNRLKHKLWKLSNKYFDQYEKEIGDAEGIVWIKKPIVNETLIFVKKMAKLPELVASFSMMNSKAVTVEEAKAIRLSKINNREKG